MSSKLLQSLLRSYENLWHSLLLLARSPSRDNISTPTHCVIAQNEKIFRQNKTLDMAAAERAAKKILQNMIYVLFGNLTLSDNLLRVGLAASWEDVWRARYNGKTFSLFQFADERVFPYSLKLIVSSCCASLTTQITTIIFPTKWEKFSNLFIPSQFIPELS